jgi:hypothetical protein
LFWPLFVSALLPTTLSDALLCVAGITDRLDALDYSTRSGQVEQFRQTLRESDQLRLPRRKTARTGC